MAPGNVLLIEDNADAREALRALLELDGYEVEVAENGPRGLEIVRTKRPAIAVIDIGLPGMDGFELAQRLRELGAETGHRPALVALTGYNSPEDRRRVAEAGFAAHLVKPVDPAELTRVLAGLAGTPGSAAS